MVAVTKALSGDPSDRFSLAWPDILHDLAPLDATSEQVRESRHARTPELVREVQPAIDFVRAGAQIQARRRVQAGRQHYVEIVRDYLARSFEARIRATENRVMSLRARELAGDSDVTLARQRGQPVRLSINEWLKARQLGESY